MPVVRNDWRKVRLTSTPPKAPVQPPMPMSAREWRRASRAASSMSTPSAIRRAALAWKMLGIILYTDPLPIPLRTNRTTNPATNSGSDPWFEAVSTMPAPKAIRA